MQTPNRPTWLQDSEVTACMNCAKMFTLFLRKHHCRECGKIYCNNCCANYIDLSKLGYTEPQRVCVSCYSKSSKKGSSSKPGSITRAREPSSSEELRLLELTEKLKENPTNPVLLNNRGLAYCYLKRYEDSEADFEAALKYATPETQNVVPHVTFNRAAWAYLKQHKYDLTIEECTKGLEMNEDKKALHHKFYNTRAVAYDRLGQSQKALKDYTSAIDTKPTGQYYANRGTVYRQLAQYDNAKSDFNNALALCPNQADFLRNRALLYIDLGQYEDAMSDLDGALTARPKFADAFGTRASLFLEQGKYAQALDDLKTCLTLDPVHILAHAVTALVYASKRDRDKAMEAFHVACGRWEKAYEYDRKFYEGCLRMELGDYEEALKFFDESWKLKKKKSIIVLDIRYLQEEHLFLQC